MNFQSLQTLAYNSILNLVSEDGINASGRNEVFGCLFGRDAAVSILNILETIPHYKTSATINTTQLLEISKLTLTSLASLQGTEVNLESGEEPGKFIHEYRKDNFERLLTAFSRPWYVYPDGKIRNYDSIDSTPLTLIAFYNYWEVSQDDTFIQTYLPVIEKGLEWIVTFADKDRDHLIEYELPQDRIHGGLSVQSWTDSTESLVQADGTFPRYPIAPVEAQGYAWLALKQWADYFEDHEMKLYADHLRLHSAAMKHEFNQKFMMMDQGKCFPVQALDGQKNQIKTITGNPLLLLWASYKKNDTTESILDTRYIQDLVDRSFTADIFDPEAGIRTMSMLSPTYISGADCYHNGSFWPKLNGMAYIGLKMWKYNQEAEWLRIAALKPLEYFQSPIELYIREDGNLIEYKNSSGQTGCREQAWTAAVMLNLTAGIS